MNKIYEFTLHPSGHDPKSPRFYRIGAGTLNDGIAIIKDMEKQFGEWFDKWGSVHSIDLEKQLFKLRIPSDATPIWLWEGADLMASGGPFGERYGEELFENYEYSCDKHLWNFPEEYGYNKSD